MSVKIIGHRGAKGEMPENTLMAFQYALDIGVHALELDIHLTKDKKIVVIHDNSINRTSNGKGNINNLTLKELQQYDFGKEERVD